MVVLIIDLLPDFPDTLGYVCNPVSWAGNSKLHHGLIIWECHFVVVVSEANSN